MSTDFQLLADLLATVVVLQAVHIGVMLSGLFLAFFRDFLKSV
ncbi:MAG: hypothetical protein ACRC46_13350 [Thermoguttaceae bacterium]